MNKFNYCVVLLWNLLCASIRKLIGRSRFKRFFYYGKRIKGEAFTNEYIYTNIVSGKPFLVARFGDAELRTVMYSIEQSMGFRNRIPSYIKEKMKINAGFFPIDDKYMYKFGELMLESSKFVDLFAIWNNIMEDYVIFHMNRNAELCYGESIDPFRSDMPWTRALKGKRVLVVHPFAVSIAKQYKHREKLPGYYPAHP